MVDDAPWLDQKQLEAWITLMALLEAMPDAIDEQLKADAGMNLFEYTVLAMLSEHPDRTLTMSDLADMAFGSLSRLSHAVTRLERRGWVERRAGSGGRRHNVVSLTEAGLETTRSAAPGHARHVRELLVDPLTDRELAALTKIGRKVLGAADPELRDFVVAATPEIVARNRS